MKRSNQYAVLALATAVTAGAQAEVVTFEGVGSGDQFSFVNGPFRTAEAIFNVTGSSFMNVYSESGPNAPFLPLDHALGSPNGTLTITPRTDGSYVTLSGFYGQVAPSVFPLNANQLFTRDITATSYDKNGAKIDQQTVTVNSIFGSQDNYKTFSAPLSGSRIEITGLGNSVFNMFDLLTAGNPNTRTLKDPSNAFSILDNIVVHESPAPVPLPPSGYLLVGAVAIMSSRRRGLQFV